MLAALLAALVLAPTAPASAADVPWSDPNAQGVLGLCDAAGHPVTSGRLDAKPFVGTAVSSVAAPAGYDAQASAKGTLYAYQPRQGVDPGDWSGTQLTASSWYSNARHPMAQGTSLDYSLADYLSIYPAKWDGLVQLRLFVSAPNKQLVAAPYPAAVLRVKDGRWEVVQGGTVDCRAGKAQSVEHVYLPKSRFASASPSPVTSAGTSSTTGSGSASASGGSGSADVQDTSGADSTSASAGSSASRTGWGIGIAAAGLVVLALVGLRRTALRTSNRHNSQTGESL
jgi:hypothetical protein